MRGLYVITDPKLISATKIVDSIAEAITGGAAMVQYRNKSASYEQKLREAQDLSTLCRSLQVPFIVNDEIELAQKVKASGVHLGQTDDSVSKARSILGAETIIGISCHNSLELAFKAQAAGADYVAFGRFFPSQTKPEALPAGIELLLEARTRLKIPIVAIGGITAENAGGLITAGADMLAVIHGVFGTESIINSAKLIARQFDS